MFYSAELEFLQSAFKKRFLKTHIVHPDDEIGAIMDTGLLRLLDNGEYPSTTIIDMVSIPQHNTVYRLTDSFKRSYIFFLLPKTASDSALIIGPFLKVPLTRKQIIETAESHNVSPADIDSFIKYYSSLAVLSYDSSIYALLESFFDIIWGKDEEYTTIELNYDFFDIHFLPGINRSAEDQEKIEWNMQMMEQRYSYENELMQAVSKGQLHKAEMLATAFSSLNFESRHSDPVRNLKNYSIVMNTLLRKAAENGGVHPLYIDKLSSEFAIRIEQLTTVKDIESLMIEMFRSYCRLVKKNKGKNYSAPVQKAIIRIDSDLSVDLSLSALAAAQNISPAYLSNIFKQETGSTITDFVTAKRMELAKQLLSTTNILIQTVAMHCGIMDVQYFSRVFKKHTGKTPKEFRKSVK